MNFVFFIPDEMRAESIGCHGHPVARTPNIDRFATQGVRFDQCHAQHPVCTPSRCSFLTGWYPHVRGHRSLWHPLQPDEPNLLRALRDNGYEVVYGGKNDSFSPGALAASIDDFRLGAGERVPAGRNPFAFPDPRFFSFLQEPAVTGIDELPEARIVDAAIDFLKRRPHRKPFALVLALSMPHPPYVAPPPWHGRFRPEELPPLRPPGLENKPDFHALIRRSRRLDELDERFFLEINAAYLGMIGVIDELFGRLVNCLDETALTDETAVFLFSDHGDWAGDYGLVEKWPSALDDTMTHVPFIVRAPGAKSGHVVRELTELIDLTPTTLGLAGLPVPWTQFGTDLGPQLRGAEGAPGRRAFAEGGYDDHEPQCFEGDPTADPIFRDPSHIYFPKGALQREHPESVCRATMVRSRTHLLVHRRRGPSELYDRQLDPRELCNRHSDPAMADVRATLERELLDWFQRTSDITPMNRDPRGFPR